MNRIYRSVRNEATGAVVAVAENVSCRGNRTGFVVTSLGSAFALTLAAVVHASPTGGTVVAGAATIESAANSTTIHQSSQNAVLNWNTFDIGLGESVRFVQPNSRSIALNRVLGSEPSGILGSLSANGRVFLVNPNGILFGSGAQVNVGGLVASTRDISDADFLAGRYEFIGTSDGAIENYGSINAAGGYVALLGATVSNEGIIAARLGTVALAAGNALTLDVAGDGLLNVQVDSGAVDALAQNGGLIQADGGRVLLSARSASHLLHSAINNTGVIQAQTIENRGGTIKLLGDLQSGAMNVDGTLDASAPQGGDGGFVETSAAHVRIESTANITTAATRGATGQWLIDPLDFTIAASGGDITGATLSASLSSNNVTVLSTSGSTGTAGDVNVNDVVTWNANRLTLNAQNNINVNTTMTGSGTASLALEYGQGAVAAGNTGKVNVRAPVNLPAGNNFSTRLGSDGAVVNYTVITSLGAAGSTTGTDLQGINGAVMANYALGSDIDASATSTWNSGAGFTSIGRSGDFTGTFDGLGHVVSGLVSNTPATNNVGMFGVANSATFRNVGVINATITGATYVGPLVANCFACTYSNVYSSGTVSGVAWVGGLVGLGNGTTMTNGYSSANVTGTSNLIGGLFGQARFFGTITDSYATGTVNGTGAFYVGGLAGQARFVTLTNTYATGAVTASSNAGGLVGFLDGATLNTSYSTGAVSGSFSIGGLVGSRAGSYAVNNSYWNTTTSGRATSQGGTGLTTAQMQNASSFSGWDFGSKWIVYEGHTYPLLRSFMTALTVTPNAAVKTYDGLAYSGGNGVSYSTTPNGNLLGTVTYGGTAQGATNAGSYTLSASGLYSNQQGYIVSYANGTLTVNPATLTATVVAPDKIYDGNNTATATLHVVGLVGTETLGVSNTATFNSQNVADANLVTVNGIVLSDGNNGGLASNYILASGQTTSAHITPRTLTAGITATDKVYDGNTTASATVNSLTGFVGTETVTATAIAAFNSKDVADAALVTASGFTLTDGASGGLASNYTIANSPTATAHITARTLTVEGQSALDKVYDGTTTATLTGGSLSGVVAGESLLLNEAGSFTTADVGNDIAVTANNSLVGSAAANYVLLQPTGLSANITAVAVPEAPPSAETPPSSETPPSVATPTVDYQDAVGHAESNAPVAATALSSPLALPAPVGSSNATGGASYDLGGLNLTIVSREDAGRDEPGDRGH